jgi:hypothetical protein
MAAWAGDSGPSQYCNDGTGWAGDTGSEGDVVTAPAHVAYEVVPGYSNGTWAMACYSTTPKGSDAPEAAGGRAYVAFYGDGRVEWGCDGDRSASTVATVDCTGGINPDGYPGLDHPSLTVDGNVGVGPTSAGFGDTGATTGGLPNVTPGNPNDSVTSTTVGSDEVTCVWANGVPVCPVPTHQVADTYLGTDDVQAEYRTTLDACVGAAGNPCLATAPSSAAVTVGGGDPDNQTVDGTVNNTPVTYDLGKTCVVSYNRPDCSTGPES